MANLLHRGVTTLLASAKRVMADAITYRRAGAAVTIQAVMSTHILEIIESEGMITHVEGRDFVFAAADLILAGVQALPQRGDLITASILGTDKDFEVHSIGEGDCYRLTDDRMMRVHTKRVE